MSATATYSETEATRLINIGMGMRWLRPKGRSKAARALDALENQRLSREYLDKARALGYRPCAGWLGCGATILLREASFRGFCPACEAVAQGIPGEVRGGTNP